MECTPCSRKYNYYSLKAIEEKLFKSGSKPRIVFSKTTPVQKLIIVEASNEIPTV